MTLPYQDFAGFNSSLDLLLELRDGDGSVSTPRACTGRCWSGPNGAARGWHRRGTANGSGILCVSPESVTEAHRRLKASRIICSLREGAIRLSPHCYNTVEEMERVAHVLAGD